MSGPLSYETPFILRQVPADSERFRMLMDQLDQRPKVMGVADYTDVTGDPEAWLPWIEGGKNALEYARGRHNPTQALEALRGTLVGYHTDQILYASERADKALATKSLETADQIRALERGSYGSLLQSYCGRTAFISSVVLTQRLETPIQDPIIFTRRIIDRTLRADLFDGRLLNEVSEVLTTDGTRLIDEGIAKHRRQDTEQGVMLLRGAMYVGPSEEDRMQDTDRALADQATRDKINDGLKALSRVT